MAKIASFEEFKKGAASLTEDDLEGMDPMQHQAEKEHEGHHQYYMFFKNLSAIKHYISEIEAMDPDQLDDLLKGGHDWAADHIATSKDDIQEVADWVRGELEGGEDHHHSGEEHHDEPENIVVNIEGDEDEVEVEDGKEETEEEEEENDEE